MVAREDIICERGILKSINKVLPSDENMVLILDDRIDVWNNIENLINVKPFFYFDEDKNKTNLLVESLLDDYGYDDDHSLYSVTLFLKFIHQAFFLYYSKYGIKCDVRYLKKEKMSLIFKDMNAAYIDKPNLNINETQEFKTIKNFGGFLENSISNYTNVLIKDFSQLSKSILI